MTQVAEGGPTLQGGSAGALLAVTLQASPNYSRRMHSEDLHHVHQLDLFDSRVGPAGCSSNMEGFRLA